MIHDKKGKKKMGPKTRFNTSGRDPHAAKDKAMDANKAAFDKYTKKDQGMPKKKNGKGFTGAYGGKDPLSKM